VVSSEYCNIVLHVVYCMLYVACCMLHVVWWTTWNYEMALHDMKQDN
jgi:hypothetical protein